MSGVGARRLIGIRRWVADIDPSVAFYRDALGFEVRQSTARRAVLWLGRERIELMAADAPRREHLQAWPGPDVRFQHVAIVTRDMAAAVERLHRVAPGTIAIGSGGPQRLPAATGGVTAYKFRDPDGHALELISFPAGVGDARWSASSAALTMGIDHAAISVADADRSIAYYTVVLGLRFASRQVNSGPEQARLDGLDAPVVEVVALTPISQATPHVELLAYRHPPSTTPAFRLPGELDPADRLLFEGDASLGANMETRDPDGHASVLAASPLE